tara:strand:+ start:59648 stop:61228 length:1581 start_codon:yes stop_codon:yes gene_type:complete
MFKKAFVFACLVLAISSASLSIAQSTISEKANDCDLCVSYAASDNNGWFIAKLFDTSDYPARWNCGNWSAFTGWLFICANIATSLAYIAISALIIYYIRNQGSSYNGVLWLFALFIMLCGVGHAIDASIFYWPIYRFLALWHTFTAIISLIAFAVTAKLMPEGIQALKKAKTERDLLENLFRYSRIGKCHVALDGRFIKANPRLYEILGYDESELMNMTFQDITYKDDLNTDLYLVQQTIDNKIDNYTLEKRYIHKNGHIVWVEITVSMIRDRQGKNLHFIVEVIDITDQKQSDQDMLDIKSDILQSNQELESFAYAISHDLKAPLRGIDNLSQWIAEDIGTAIDPDIAHKLGLLRERTGRMQKLIDGLLEYSRIGRQDTEVEEFDTQEAIQNVIGMIGRNAEFNVKNMPVIYGNQTRFTQVISNLVDNAIKYNDSEVPSIKIGCSDNEKFYEFYVKDNGKGIDKKFHDKIFDMFSKLTPKDDGEGVGVGLALVKRIVTQLGGNVRVSSQIGKGSTFYFTWPKRER